MKKAWFHIHTKYSFDSLLDPKVIIKEAIKKKIDYLFITDHNTIKGAKEAEEYVLKNKIPIKIVVGSEISTDIGDIIGIFLKKDILARKYEEVISEIKSQGGLVVLPHPYKGHDLFKIHFLKNIDFVETFNSRTTIQEDEFARKLKNYLKAHEICGCDAHLIKDLNKCYLQFKNLSEFKKGNLKINTFKKTKLCDISKTQIIKYIKKRNYSNLFPELIKYLGYRALRL